MAIVIELVSGNVVLDGYETWWDDVEAAIAKTPLDYPVLSTVDPYGAVEIRGDDLTRMARELDALIPTSVPRTVVDGIAGLCARARTIDDARLIFRGD
jgi:hypothetical protein